MPADLATVTWNPPTGYGLAVEVLTIAELRRRGSEEHFRAAQRVAFFLILGVTRGRTDHVIDLEAQPSKTRSWLLVRPGQTQRFDFSRPWRGLAVIFRPEILPPADREAGPLVASVTGLLDELPGRIETPGGEHSRCCAIVHQMRQDAVIAAGARERNALLLNQLEVLLLRLALAAGAARRADRGPSATALVAALRRQLEERFHDRPGVDWHARRLGVSSRTLSRVIRAVAGVSAKTFLAERTALEARRLLVHTRLSLQEIAERLGFAEATSLVKFFRRQVGVTPGAFRASAGGDRVQGRRAPRARKTGG